MHFFRCPWCDHKISPLKDLQFFTVRKNPALLRFGCCSHCRNYYGQTFTGPLQKMTGEAEPFVDTANYQWDIPVDRLSRRISYCKAAPNGWNDESLVITEDGRYGVFFYNICEVSMCRYNAALAVFSSDNPDEPLMDLSPEAPKFIGRIEGYHSFCYGPLSDCIVTVCNVSQALPFLLLKPSERKFTLIPFDHSSIYYSVREAGPNLLILEESTPSIHTLLEENGFSSQAGTQWSLNDLRWYDIRDFTNIEEIYSKLKAHGNHVYPI